MDEGPIEGRTNGERRDQLGKTKSQVVTNQDEPMGKKGPMKEDGL